MPVTYCCWNCGEPFEPVQGWATTPCAHCGADHRPRSDSPVPLVDDSPTADWPVPLDLWEHWDDPDIVEE